MSPSNRDFAQGIGPGLEESLLGDESHSELDIKEYVQRLRQHWRLIVVCCLLALTAGIVHYFITPKQYLAYTTLQIERRSLLPQFSNSSPWIESWWNMEYYPTQERLLQSRSLAERVVRELRLMDDPIFNGPQLALIGQDNDGEPTALEDEMELTRLAQRIQGGLGIKRDPTTQIFTLTYRSEDAVVAARLVNGFADGFIDMGIEDRFRNAGQASSFFGTEIAALKEEIGERELELQAVSRRTDIVDLDPEANVIRQRLSALNQDFIEAKKERIEKEARYQELLAQPAESVADQYLGGEVTAQRNEVLNLEREYHSKLNIFKPEWPQMQELKSRIDKTQQNLARVIQENATKARETVRAEVQAARRQELALDEEINSSKAESMDQRSQTLEYVNLEEEVRTRRELLSELLRRQNETEVTARLQNTRQSNVRIVDTALVPGAPFRPSLRRDLMLGLLSGLMLGLALAALVEFLDRTIKGGEELERILRVPTLAVIPDIADDGRSYGYFRRYYGQSPRGSGKPPRAKKSSRRWLDKRGGSDTAAIELLPHSRPRLAAAEAYRSLRTALMLSTADDLRLVAITSAEAGEGKTSTAANLAVVMAQLGKNVLLIDADLRKPRQHKLFKVSNRIGLVSHLTGGAEPDAILGRTNIPNLFLCPSGPIPPNPSELLSSERMRQFLELVRSRFDFVIVDTPPALAVTDAILLGAMADGVVLCSRAGFLQRDGAKAVRDRLRVAEVRVLGAVLNRYRSASGGYGSSRKYLYYESYGVDEDTEQSLGEAQAQTKTDSAA